jgi:probable HAF family extracellular repeat protein
VNSVSPTDGSTCVSQNPTVRVQFNASSAPHNVTTDNFKVSGPFGEQEGVVTWKASSGTATWKSGPFFSRQTIGPDLGMLSKYTATISGFTGGPYSFTFQTGPCGPPSLYPSTSSLFDIPNSKLTWIFGINNAGSLTGQYEDQDGNDHGYLFANNQITDLKGQPRKSNDANAVVGIYGPYITGYLYESGQYTDIIDPGANVQGDQNWAYGINNSGVIVGRWNANHVSSFITSRGFIRQPDGSYKDFNPTDAASLSSGTFPVDINNSGHAVGQSGNGSWFYDGNTFAAFPVQGCSSIQTEGLSDLDDVVGQANGCSTWNDASTAANHVSGGSFVKRGSTFYQLTVPGCQRLQAFDVNSSGVVVGICTDQRGDHGFVITPQ